MRAVSIPLLLLACLASTSVLAQNMGQNSPEGAPEKRQQLQKDEQKDSRLNQRAERIQVEDEGSRVNELRVGGQTQSITVQPKTGDMPEYEVQSPDGARSRAGSRSGAETNTAPRVWNVIKF